ncbi:hypothetical protein Mgra_00007018 [Meloidogyne graminicola]|uniref:Uncharacterized protein n=1 Tax=Meloidogyne graminicola TaxID=189291 RepID=A0A8S9ZJS3_9BILA|nr:hypothetical protein Mgra_00007018 [Meloidogyne graminicola]
MREDEEKEEKAKFLQILEKHFERQNKMINTFCAEMTNSNKLVFNQLRKVINKEEDVTDKAEESKPGTSGTSSVSDTGPTISDTDISPERKRWRPSIGSPRKEWFCHICQQSMNIKSRSSHLNSKTHNNLAALLNIYIL